jgi:hypothetical protein
VWTSILIVTFTTKGVKSVHFLLPRKTPLLVLLKMMNF